MKIALLTYNYPHRKTQDVLFRLLVKGFKDITLVILPWAVRDNFKPLYSHRPTNEICVYPGDLAKTFGVESIYIPNYSHLQAIDVDYFIIGGAGIINPLPDVPVINSHPGYLPIVRGLDALKWAVYYRLKIGVTVHRINKDIDSGDIIERKEIFPCPGEQFYHFAMRQYNEEITMLVDYFSNSPQKIDDDYYSWRPPQPMRRMSHGKELKMMRIFESGLLDDPKL